MRQKVPLVRLLTAAAVALLACAFVSQYGWVAKVTCEPDASLPALTGLVWRYSSYAYTLPVPVLLFGVFFLRRSSGDSVGLEERLRELEKLCVMEVVDPESGKVVARQVPAPNAHQKQLLEALKLELPATVPAAEVIVGTRKKINNVRQTRMALS